MPDKRGAPLEGGLIAKKIIRFIYVWLAATNGPPAPLSGQCQVFEIANKLSAEILSLLDECWHTVHCDPARLLVCNVLDTSVSDFVCDQCFVDHLF